MNHEQSFGSAEQPDFDRFLADLAEESKQQAAIEAGISEVKEYFGHALQRYDTALPRLIDPDPERATALQRAEMRRLTPQYYNQLLQTAPDKSPEEVARAAKVQAVGHVMAQAHREQEWLTDAQMCTIVIWRTQQSPEATTHVEAMKWGFVAQLSVLADGGSSNPWVEFYNDVIPGPRLDLNSDKALSLQAAALTELQAASEQRAQLASQVEALQDILSEHNDRLSTMNLASHIILTAVRTRSAHARESALDEMLRALPEGTTIPRNAVLEFLAKRFPYTA